MSLKKDMEKPDGNQSGVTQLDDEIKELIKTLEKDTIFGGVQLRLYENFWYRVRSFPMIVRSQKNFTAHNSDILLSTMPKCGTTWLKALTFTIVNRNIYSLDQSPLLTTTPHDLVPFLEFNLYAEQENPNLKHIPEPRLFATHMPYSALSKSIVNSDCRIIYICRNPMDQFTSHIHFMLENKNVAIGSDESISMDETFDMFCRGVYPFGPFWDHVLGYWNAQKKNPKKVLFLKYEDLKKDIHSNVKKIAKFIGLPFSLEEEKQCLIEQISELCSFKHLKDLEVNKSGGIFLKNSTYFRKGEVGDSVNYLTPTMVKRMENIFEEKLRGSGLRFEFS